MALVKFILLVPLRYNDGRKISAKVMNGIRTDLFALADGYSIAGRVRGAYRMKDGSQKNDKTTCFWLVVTEDKVQALRAIIADICRLLGQESMYLERVESSVEFVKPSISESGGDPDEAKDDDR
jgi:hypothetical protein